MVQGSGSGIASSGDWIGPKADTGRYTLIGGLVLQLVAFSLFLAIFRRFHVLANRFGVPQAPVGWRKVVLSVYVSSSMIMVGPAYNSHSLRRLLTKFRSVAFIVSVNLLKAWKATHFETNGYSGCLRLCLW